MAFQNNYYRVNHENGHFGHRISTIIIILLYIHTSKFTGATEYDCVSGETIAHHKSASWGPFFSTRGGGKEGGKGGKEKK